MAAYYNENDPKAAAWLRELIKAGLIAPGDVDERSITEVKPDDLTAYQQCHFFAGIGGWSYALRLAGVPDDEPVWTGSCPCQPFSAAGKQKGTEDERHLWPEFARLIAKCAPPIVFGEQVASKLGRQWLTGVFADLEGMGYACAGADLCAPGVSAPHIRQRLYWVANASNAERWPFGFNRENEFDRQDARRTKTHGEPRACSEVRRLADTDGRHASEERQQRSGEQRQQPEDGSVSRMGDASSQGLSKQRGINGASRETSSAPQGEAIERAGTPASAWSRFDILHCLDGKARRVEAGTFPLANGVSDRVGLLRGYGNAIVPQVAAEFIKASIEAINDATLLT